MRKQGLSKMIQMSTEEWKYDMKPHRLHLVLVLYQGNGTYIMPYVRSLICHYHCIWTCLGFCVVVSVGWRGKSQIHNTIVSPLFYFVPGSHCRSGWPCFRALFFQPPTPNPSAGITDMYHTTSFSFSL